METPVELERSTFESQIQFSSPVNSIIDESPVTPASPSRSLPAYPQGQQVNGNAAIPLDKAQARSPQEMHPAHYAPYTANSPTQPALHQVPPKEPQSPGPLPVKVESQRHPSATATVPVTDTFDPPPTTAIDRRETYNPDSLAGPNGAPVESHRPGQVSHPNAMVDPHWKHGLCEPDALCCMGAICPCMVYGKTMYRLSRRTQKQDPTDLLGYESCNGSCGLMAVACGIQGMEGVQL